MPVTTIDEGIVLSTDRPAGERGSDGLYPPQSLNRLVEDRLHIFARIRQSFGQQALSTAAESPHEQWRRGSKRMVVGLPQGLANRAAVEAAVQLAELLRIELLATFIADFERSVHLPNSPPYANYEPGASNGSRLNRRESRKISNKLPSLRAGALRKAPRTEP